MPRTDPGEGSVYQRQDGRWVAVLRWEGRRIPCYGATRAQALAARRDRRLVEATHQDRVTTPTVADWLTQWQAAQAPRWAAKTQAYYAALARLHITPTLGPVRLADLTPAHIDGWQADLRATGRGATTARNAWKILHTACAAAVRRGLLAANPVARATHPRPASPRTTALTADEAAAVLAVAAGTPWHPLLLLALHTGMRLGEVLGLQWADLDWTTGRLTIRHALTGERSAAYALAAPKAHSGRVLPLPAPVVAALQTHRQTCPPVPGDWPDLVFHTAHGTPLDPNEVRRAWQRLCRRAGVPVLPFHSIRHTAATLLLDAGLSLPVLLAWFGWRSSAMLLRVYAHPRPADLQAVGAALAVRLLHSADGTQKEGSDKPSCYHTPAVFETAALGRYATGNRHKIAPKWTKKPLKGPA